MQLLNYSLVVFPALFSLSSATLGFQLGGKQLSDPVAACRSLGASLAIENVTVNFATYLPAGSNITLTQDYNLSTCGYTSQVVSTDLCRLAMYVATSNRSGITLEAWLPTNWTGRFLSTGNGGVSGCIQYADLAYTSGLGFATVGANNGHNGTRGFAFANNTDVVEDFAIRSLHTGVVVGKKITKKYYGSAHKKSYYLGCSTGGRQGFKSVQTYPKDFDGVLAGAPAFNYNALTSWSAHFYTIFGNSSAPTFVSRALWTVINKEILNQCDGIDGVVDGILEDPELCRFRPEALQCAPGVNNSTTCLTGVQVGAVRAAFTDYYGEDGKMIYPRMQPGSEGVAVNLYYSGTTFPYSDDWFKYVVYNDSNWDPKTFTIKDAAFSLYQNPFNIATWDADISAFKNAGGKLLHYHGLMDGVISSENSPLYYDRVSRTMGLNSSSLDDFYRFFRVSGMGHCSGGNGAHLIGNQIVQLGSTFDSQHNVLLRIVDWVENSKAPETITGIKFVNDTASLGVELVRDHCKYPKRNICIDPANHASAKAWKCV